MSYFADIIKSEIQRQLQYAAEIDRANQILETVPAKQEESESKIAKAVKAAFTLEEEQELSQALYDAYPDVDPTDYGLPEPQEKRVERVETPEDEAVESTSTALEIYDVAQDPSYAPTPEPSQGVDVDSPQE